MRVTTSIARRCPKCKQWAMVPKQQHEINSLEELDEMPFASLPLEPVVCCGVSAAPTHLVFAGEEWGDPHFVPLGTPELPVADQNLSQEESERLDRGAELQLKLWREQRKEILDAFYNWIRGENLWQKVVDEVQQKEMQEAFAQLEWAEEGYKVSWSQAQHFLRKVSADDQRRFFDIVSGKMLEEIVWHLHWAEWPVERWRHTWGKTRILWPVVHMPLVEDLESQRISAIAKLNITKRPESAILFERVRSLENNARRLNEQAKKQADLLVEARTKQHEGEEKLAKAYEQIRMLREENIELCQRTKSEPDRRVRKLKALITEMREELHRLRPVEEDVRLAVLEETLLLGEDKGATDESLNLADKIIGIIGGMRGEQAASYPNVRTIPGEEDPTFERFLGESDVLVILTQHVSHASMWAAKEHATIFEKPIVFTRHINIPVILREIQNS